MRERDRPRLAKFLSYGDSSISGSLYPGYYVSQIYGPATAVNNNNNSNNSYPPSKPPTSPTSKRKSRSKTKSKRSQSKQSKQNQSQQQQQQQQQQQYNSIFCQQDQSVFEAGLLSLDTASPPRKRRSPSKSRPRSQSRPPLVVLDPSGGQAVLQQPLDVSSPVLAGSRREDGGQTRGRSRSKAVKRTKSIKSPSEIHQSFSTTVSNIENEPPPIDQSEAILTNEKHHLGSQLGDTELTSSCVPPVGGNKLSNCHSCHTSCHICCVPPAGGNKRSRGHRHRLRLRRSQSEAPQRADQSEASKLWTNEKAAGKSLWEDLTSQARDNIQNYIYKSTGRGQCSDSLYPQSVLANLNSRGRSKSRSRRSGVSSTAGPFQDQRSVVSSTAGPYSLGSSPYVAPSTDPDLLAASSSNNVTSISVPGVGVRARSKSRSRLAASITNGMSTVWPDSRGAWLPV